MPARGGVLLVGPRSPGPLVGGIENGIDMILRSSLVDRHGLRFYNSFRERDPHRSVFERMRYQLSVFLDFLRTLLTIRPELVHVKVADGVNFLQGVGYVVLSRLTRRPALLQIHGGEFDAWYREASRWRKAVIRWCLNTPTALLVLSDYWRDYVALLLPTPKPIHVVPNGVELDHLPASVPSSDGRLRVLTIGAIGARKGHFDIVEAAIILGAGAPFVFQFVGSDDFGGETERLRRRVRDAEVAAQVEFLGPLTGDAKWSALGAADIFLLPAYNENMPNSVLEAMAASLPIVCTDVGAVRQMVGDAGARFVPAGDPKAIADVLRTLFRDVETRVRMGAANRRKATDEYSFDRVTRDLDRLYEQYVRHLTNRGAPSTRTAAARQS
jgi:glycosyltransferase involved in cell wall biosynthesis